MATTTEAASLNKTVIKRQHGNINPPLFSLCFSISLSNMFYVCYKAGCGMLPISLLHSPNFNGGAPSPLCFQHKTLKWREGDITHILNDKESNFRLFRIHPCPSLRALFCFFFFFFQTVMPFSVGIKPKHICVQEQDSFLK